MDSVLVAQCSASFNKWSGCPGFSEEVPHAAISIYFGDANMQGQGSEAFHFQARVTDIMQVLGSFRAPAESQGLWVIKDRSKETAFDITPPINLTRLASRLVQAHAPTWVLLWIGVLRKAITASDAVYESDKGSAGSYLWVAQTSLR